MAYGYKKKSKKSFGKRKSRYSGKRRVKCVVKTYYR